jgi:hypothetical protein
MRLCFSRAILNAWMDDRAFSACLLVQLKGSVRYLPHSDTLGRKPGIVRTASAGSSDDHGSARDDYASIKNRIWKCWSAEDPEMLQWPRWLLKLVCSDAIFPIYSRFHLDSAPWQWKSAKKKISFLAFRNTAGHACFMSKRQMGRSRRRPSQPKPCLGRAGTVRSGDDFGSTSPR